MDLTTPEGVKSYMEASTSEDDWNKRCDDVKDNNNGYPDFWFDTIVLSGLMAKTARKWG